jgi:polyphosphate kinase 2 (PPK2 family)
MGFCTPEETELFLDEAPEFEKRLTKDGIRLFKFWLSIGREMQLKRFHERRHDPLKVWKLSPIDIEALHKWDDYTVARDEMLKRTDCPHAPWTVIRANDKHRGRINVIQTILDRLTFAGKDTNAIGEIDPRITLTAEDFLALKKTD